MAEKMGKRKKGVKLEIRALPTLAAIKKKTLSSHPGKPLLQDYKGS